MVEEKNKLLLIDGNSVTFRAFFALHNSLSRFVNHEGLHTNAIYGFKNMLDSILTKVNPTHILELKNLLIIKVGELKLLQNYQSNFQK